MSVQTVTDINFLLLVANLIFTYTLHALNIPTVYKEKMNDDVQINTEAI